MGNHHPYFLIVSGFFAAASVTAKTPPPPPQTSFVHRKNVIRRRSPSSSTVRTPPATFLQNILHRPPLPLHAAPGDEDYDPLDLLMIGDRDDSSVHLPPPSSSSWGVGDDWSRLSSADVANAASMAAVSSPSLGTAFDAMDEAARILEEQERMRSEWEEAAALAADGSGDATSGGSSAKKGDLTFVKALENDFVEDAVDMISSNSDYNEPDGVQLYDTIASSSSATKQEKNQEDELAFMIRCNQSPEQFLISQGRALPELTDEVKYSPEFLLEKQSIGIGESSVESVASRLPLKPKATAYFQRAIQTIFDTHSVQVEEERGNGKVHMHVLDREAISKWMTRCFTSSLSPSKKYQVGPYDQSVSAVLSRYSHSHGSGRLTHEEFEALYLEVAWAGYIRDVLQKKTTLVGHTEKETGKRPLPSADDGVLLRGKRNTEKMLKQASVSLIWRDLEAHEIFSPAEVERVEMLREMERLRAKSTNALATGTATAAAARDSSQQFMMDECELLDEYEDRLSYHLMHSEENDDDVLGMGREWQISQRKEKSSHELVEMAFDGKTPKRIRDGQFVFIDEESCIGCTQCAQIAPSTFKMIEDTGRARTYSQSNSLDIENAVMACPVTCMHFVSFDELKEMESSRDGGDGRTDHRHFGGRRTHTPLHVAGRDSDANHKSSWYHYLKWKCHGSSCPQRGCFDCPSYAPGENPYFKERHKRAELTRAKDFIESGEADKWRKVVEL